MFILCKYSLCSRYDNPYSKFHLLRLKKKLNLEKVFIMDKSLSKDEVSCNTCHRLDQHGVDGLEFSIGVDNQLDKPFNTPTTFNSVFNFVQFWNGRAKDLAEQAKVPFLIQKKWG